MLGTTEIVIIVGIVALLFGSAAIPKLARALGSAQGEFQKAKKAFTEEMESTKRAVSDSSVDESDLRRTARGLGLDVTGRSDAELKERIKQRLT